MKNCYTCGWPLCATGGCLNDGCWAYHPLSHEPPIPQIEKLTITPYLTHSAQELGQKINEIIDRLNGGTGE